MSETSFYYQLWLSVIVLKWQWRGYGPYFGIKQKISHQSINHAANRWRISNKRAHCFFYIQNVLLDIVVTWFVKFCKYVSHYRMRLANPYWFTALCWYFITIYAVVSIDYASLGKSTLVSHHYAIDVPLLVFSIHSFFIRITFFGWESDAYFVEPSKRESWF